LNHALHEIEDLVRVRSWFQFLSRDGQNEFLNHETTPKTGAFFVFVRGFNSSRETANGFEPRNNTKRGVFNSHRACATLATRKTKSGKREAVAKIKYALVSEKERQDRTGQ
jgi:hypothetical protein